MKSSLPQRREKLAELVASHGYDHIVLGSAAAFGYVTGTDSRSFVSPPLLRLSADGKLLVSASSADEAGLGHLDADVTVQFWQHHPGIPAARQAAASIYTARCATEGKPFDGIGAQQPANDGAAIFAEATHVKFEDEIAHLREAANLADIAYTAVVDRLHPELRAYEIARNVDRSLRAAGGGGHWSLRESESDLGSTAVFPSSGILGLLDRVPESGVLDVEHPLPFQVHPLSHAYMGAAGTTVMFREPDSGIREAAKRLSAGLERALAALTPGANTDLASNGFAAELGILPADLVAFSIGTGPGEVVSAPGISKELRPGNAIALRATVAGEQGRPGLIFQTAVLLTDVAAERLDVVVPLRLIELY